MHFGFKLFPDAKPNSAISYIVICVPNTVYFMPYVLSYHYNVMYENKVNDVMPRQSGMMKCSAMQCNPMRDSVIKWNVM